MKEFKINRVGNWVEDDISKTELALFYIEAEDEEQARKIATEDFMNDHPDGSCVIKSVVPSEDSAFSS